MGNERIRVAILIGLFVSTFVAVQVTTRYHRQQKREPNWNVVPYQVDGWSGFDGRFDPIYGADPSDTRLLRVYRQAAEPPVIVYVGFFGDLATILDVHTPELCYPAEGWEILRSGNLPPPRIFAARRFMRVKFWRIKQATAGSYLGGTTPVPAPLRRGSAISTQCWQCLRSQAAPMAR